MYYFEAKNDQVNWKSLYFVNGQIKTFCFLLLQITLEMLAELVAKIKQDLDDVDKTSEKQMLIDHFNRTLEYLKTNSESETSPFHGISL